MPKEPARPDPDSLIGTMLGAGSSARAANAQLDNALREVLMGYFTEMGGGREVGREMAAITKDEQVQPNVKVNLFGHVMRLAGQYAVESDPSGELASPEDIERENAALERMAKGQ